MHTKFGGDLWRNTKGTMSTTTHFLSVFCEEGVIQQCTEAQAGVVQDGLTFIIIIIIYPLITRVAWAPQMISQPVSSSHGESRAKYNLREPIPLHVEHVAIEFIVVPFHPSGPFLLTMKISA